MNWELDSNQKAKLLVLLPEQWAGNLDLARNIYRLASHANANVIYLVALSNSHSTLPVIRSMVTMTALTEGSETVASYELVVKTNWVRTIKNLYRPQDTIIAPKELSEMPGSNDFTTLHNANRFLVQDFARSTSHSLHSSSKRHLF